MSANETAKSDKIVALYGGSISDLLGEANATIVGLLEMALDRAKNGQTAAICISEVDVQGWTLNNFYYATHRSTLVGSISRAAYEINKKICDEDG